MGINRIENVLVDDSNKVFGGYIYNIDYQAFGGEQPSTLKLTLINEEGAYFIEPDDLRSIGSPTEIRIGSNILLKMYLISYRLENSSVGKILEVEYSDDSIVFLDKKYVGLNFRQLPNDNVILVGRRFINQSFLGMSVLSVAENQNIKVPDVLYTFPELLDALSKKFGEGFFGSLLELDGSYDNFYKNYTGTLRQVLSSWTNDLGFSFYWENSKLNFIDLRGIAISGEEGGPTSDIYNVVKSKVDALLEELDNSTESTEESFSIRDTFSRGVNSVFLKDGDVIQGSEVGSEKKGTISFNVIPEGNIPGFSSIDSQAKFRINIAHYDMDFLIALMAARESLSDYKNYYDSYGEAIFQHRILESSDPIVRNIKNNLLGELPHEIEDYFWYEIDNINIDRFKNDFEIYKNFSNFFGRFFYYASEFSPDIVFDTNDVVWYDRGTLVKNTIIGKVLGLVSNKIPNYQNLTLMSLIGLTSESGFYIKEIQPEWKINDKTKIFNNENMVIIEGNSDSSSITLEKTIVGIWKDSSFSYSSITRPTVKRIDVPTREFSRSRLDSVINAIEWFRSEYPTNFESSNAMNIDIIQNSLPEDLILSQNLLTEEQAEKTFLETLEILGDDINAEIALGLVLAKSLGQFYYTQSGLSYSAFLSTHNLFSKNMVINQEKPFFSKSFVLPYVSLPSTPSIRDGFQSLSISIGANGVKARYTFGTENMKIRTSDFYLQNYYDTKRGASINLLMPKGVLVNRGNYRINY